jgi:hypothetical protein
MADLTCPNCGNKLTVPERITRFACNGCGVEYDLYRGGGIVALEPVHSDLTDSGEAAAAPDHRAEIERLERELEAETYFEIAGAPAYQLLRYDFERIGRLNFVHVGFANEKTLEKIFRDLSGAEIEKIISLYQKNPNGPTAAWLKRVKSLKQTLEKLRSDASD